jgi:hypothetical protein
VLQFFPVEASPTAGADAVAALAALADQGIEAKVLSSDEWVLTPELKRPSFVLYVDGATRDAADAACQHVLAVDPAAVPSGCLQPRQVSPTSPTATP